MSWSQIVQPLLDILPGFSVLLLLHFLRRAFGTPPLTMLLGVFMMISLLSGVPNFAYEMQFPNTTGPMSFGALAFPVFTMMLIIYEVHGNVETQRLILGLTASILFAGLFILLLLNHFAKPISVLFGSSLDLVHFLTNIRQSANIFIATHLILLFSLPIIYQALRNFRCPIWLSFLICNLLILMSREMDIVYLYPNISFKDVETNWLLRVLTVIAVSIAGAAYIMLTNSRTVGQRGTFSIFTSIFRHLQSTDKLRRSMEEWTEKYQIVLNHASEFIFLVNSRGLIINANLRAYQLLGTRLEHDLTLADFILNDDLTPFSLPDNWTQTHLTETSFDKPVMFSHCFMTLEDPQKKIEIDFNLSHATLEGENIAVLIARDMTELHEQERMKNVLQEQLYHSQRLESLGILAGGVAHDFNNLLHSIQGSSDSIRHTRLEPTAQTMLTIIDEATARAADLTRQLLGFARKGNFNVELCDLASISDKAASLFLTMAGKLTFRKIIEPQPLVVKADAVQLQQVILNLLINAKDAVADSPTPKIVLRAESARDQTPEWDKRPSPDLDPADYVCLKVKDNGSGIPDDVREHIFEPFFTTKPVGKGTGMGLAMAYGCIAAFKGWLHVESSPQKGSEFTIVLPKAKDL